MADLDRFNNTIPVDSFQAGRGGIGAGQWEPLDRYSHTGKVYRGVLLRNTDTGGTVMSISLAKFGSDANLSLNSVQIPPSSELFLEIDDPSQIRVSGIGTGLDYSWVVY